MKDQDWSDSDEDDESLKNTIQNDNLMDSKEKVGEFLENQFIPDTVMMNQEFVCLRIF